MISNYLKDRTQYVTVNGQTSKSMTIECGVPQGSILGPLLFLIYINDLALISQKLDMIMFADDSNLFMSGPDIKSLSKQVNEELKKIVEWLRANRLSLNIKKTNFMIFPPKPKANIPDTDIYINQEKLTQIKEC